MSHTSDSAKPMNAASASTAVAELAVKGMHCAACVGRVERALDTVPGVVSSAVNLVSEQASLTIDPETFSPEAAIAAVQGAGYEAEPAERGGPRLEVSGRRGRRP